MLKYILLVVGFILLIKGADYFVEGSSSVAKRLRVPSMIIGLTIVAMGTSLPECAVSISASIQGNNAMAYSNVVGSNIFNLMIVCGACALFHPLKVARSTLKKEFPFSILAGILLFVFGFWGMSVNRLEGLVLVILFLTFLMWMIRSAMSSRKENAGESGHKQEYKILPVWKCIIFIIGGAAAVALGGNLVVDSASKIAESFGLSQTLIGLTIVAFGTSLPELVTSIVAAKKGEVDMALGNVIGSNIFNILLVLGLSAVLNPVGVVNDNLTDGILLIIMSALVLIFAWKKNRLNRGHGISMICIYAAYVVYIILR